MGGYEIKIRSISVCLLVILTMLASLLLTGCFGYNTPPSVNSVEQKFQNNYDSVRIIVDFLTDAGYENIYITGTDGTMLADLKSTQISDAEVSAAINKLLENQEYLQISKTGNTVQFLQWRGIRDIGCGIVYTINGTDSPEVEFLTELVPLSEDGWFYYVSDYNSWRNGETMG